MTPYNNPFLEAWTKAMSAAGELWLRPFRSTLLGQRRALEGQPESSVRGVVGSERESERAALHPAPDLDDADLRDALHTRLAELQAFLNDAMAGQFVRRAAMSESLEAMRGELEAALDDLDRLRAERASLDAGLAATRAEADGLRAAFREREESLQLRIGERESLIAALTAERDALVVGLDEVRTESGRLQDAKDEAIACLRREVERLENELAESLTTLEQARSRGDAGAARLAWLEPALDTARAEVEVLRQEERDRDGLQAQVDALEPQLADAMRVMAEAQETRDQLEARVAQLEALVDARCNDLQQVRDERDGLRAQVDALAPQLADAMHVVAEAHATRDALEARVAQLEALVDARRDDLQQVRDERDGLRAQVDALAPQLADAMHVVGKARETRVAVEAAVAQLEALVGTLRADLEQVRSERDGLIEKTTDLEAALAALGRERDAAREAAGAGEARLEELELALAALRTGVERVGTERDEARALAARAQASAGELEARLETLAADAARARQERDALVTRVGALEAELVRRAPMTRESSPARAGGDESGAAAMPSVAAAGAAESHPVPAVLTAATLDADARGPSNDASLRPHALPDAAISTLARVEPRFDRSETPAPAAARVGDASPSGATTAAPIATAPAAVTRLAPRAPALELHFRKPDDWASSVFMHYWTPTGLASVWPGVRMAPEAGGWYVARIEGAGEVMVVFNDSCGHQTGDLRRHGDGWYADGEWRGERPADVVRLADRAAWPDKLVQR